MAVSEEREGMPLVKLFEAVLPYHASVYVTVLNIVQCIALGFLVIEIKDKITKEIFQVELLGQWVIFSLRCAVSFTIVLVVWHRYASEFQYLWPMSWLDTIIPFSIGIVEYVIIFFTNPAIPLPWFVGSIVVFNALGIVAYKNAGYKRKTDFTERLYRSFYVQYPHFADALIGFIRGYDQGNVQRMGVLFIASVGFLLFAVLSPAYRQEITFPLVCVVALVYSEVVFGFDVSMKRDPLVGSYFR